MRRLLFFIPLIGTLFIIFVSCTKNENSTTSTGSVDLYLLDSFKTIGNTNQIDEATVVTKNNPLVAYSEILSYDSTQYTFRISDAARQAIQNLTLSGKGIAFAVKVDNHLIYTGYFWPGYSSASCNWVIIDPLLLNLRNELHVQLGYPGPVTGQIIPDRRNDKRIIEIFRRDGKLI